MSPPSSFIAFFLIATLVSTPFAQSIGMNYGSVADNLPRPPQVAAFIRDKSFFSNVGDGIRVIGGAMGLGPQVGDPSPPLNQLQSPRDPSPSPQDPSPSSSPPSLSLSQSSSPSSFWPSPPSSSPPPFWPSPSSPPSSPTTGMTFCVAKTGASEEALQSNIDYACGSGGVDCRAIQPGGPCFDQNNIQSRASYVMNAFYQKSNKQTSDCDFAGTGVLTTNDPSNGTCKYSP